MEQQGVPADAVWRYREDVWRLASQLCRHRQDAEDVTHSALLKAAQHVEGFRWEASLRTWLHRIATNECRMLRRRKVPASLDELLEAAATAPGEPFQVGAAGPGPEDAAVEAETRRRVVTALAGLPDRYRTAVLLKDGLGLPAGQVAAAMGISVPAVRSVLHRARSALRESLSPGNLDRPHPAAGYRAPFPAGPHQWVSGVTPGHRGRVRPRHHGGEEDDAARAVSALVAGRAGAAGR